MRNMDYFIIDMLSREAYFLFFILSFPAICQTLTHCHKHYSKRCLFSFYALFNINSKSFGMFLRNCCSLLISISADDISNRLATAAILSKGRGHHCSKTGNTGFLCSSANFVSLMKLSQCRYFNVMHRITMDALEILSRTRAGVWLA